MAAGPILMYVLLCDNLMVGPDTAQVAAPASQQARGQAAIHEFPRHEMGLPSPAADPELPASRPERAGGPQPAVRALVDFGPEPCF